MIFVTNFSPVFSISVQKCIDNAEMHLVALKMLNFALNNSYTLENKTALLVLKTAQSHKGE